MLLVFGPRSPTYDFGPGHPLTPRRFGPGIGLLEAVGATPGLAPEPASGEELAWCHDPRYIEVVKRLSRDPYGFAEAGIGPGGDDPPFAGMHEAAASVAGGSIRAMEAILRGDVEHAFHPGGGLHHAMPDRASGFCIYDDPALAIAAARRDGLRVLYVDLDVHHGDGVQAMHWDDPGVMTLSIHETGRYLFPGTGAVDELGEGTAAGTAINVPLEPGTGEGPWSAAIRQLLPEVAATFGPDIVVSQHGADSHAWDPLAHLRVTTTAMGAAARLVHDMAHRHAGGRWLATGGGGYDAYRVVPRVWSLVWLAGAHREVPDATPVAWRERWATEAARFGQAPLPEAFTDLPNAGEPLESDADPAGTRAGVVVAVVRRLVVPRLVREATDRGWWHPLDAGEPDAATPEGEATEAEAAASDSTPTILDTVGATTWERLRLAPRVVAPADPVIAHAIVSAAIRDRAHVSAAVVGDLVVGLAISRVVDVVPHRELLALGIAPQVRRRGLGGRLLAAHLAIDPPAGEDDVVEVTVAERDVVEPLDRRTRAEIARVLLERAGYQVSRVEGAVGAADPGAIRAIRTRADRA
jgi:acetoin utilization protein AcuC